MADRGIVSTDAVVSDDGEFLILVDGSDREIGFLDKRSCHDGEGVLHRAFSLFIFNSSGELLLQQRSADKRLWPLYWSNSCCSHPRRGETMEVATRRRLQEELGLHGELDHVFTFQYHAHYQEIGSEHEVCWVFVGRSDQEPRPNSNEIAALRWVAPGELDRELETRPRAFTPWFVEEWPRVRNLVGDLPASG